MKKTIENLKGKIIEKGKPKKKPTRYGERDFCEAKIEDEEGEVHKIALWRDQVTKVDEGDIIQIEEGTYNPEYSSISAYPGNLKVVESLHRLGEIDQLFLNEQGEPLGGFNKGEWVLIYGGPGTGKSVFCRQIAKLQVREGERVIYASTEETKSTFESHSGLEEKIVEKIEFKDLLNRSELYDANKPFLDFLGESLKNSDITIVDALSPTLPGHDSLEQLLIKTKQEKSNYPETSFVTTAYLGSSGGPAGSKLLGHVVDRSIKLEKKYPYHDQAGVEKGNLLRILSPQKSKFTKIDPRKWRFRIKNGSEIELLQPISEYE